MKWSNITDLTEQRSLAQSQRSKQTGMNGDESLESIKDGGSTLTGPTNSLWTEKQVIDEKYGVATGGLPGGGDGYGGGSYWAAGVRIMQYQAFLIINIIPLRSD